MGIPTVASPCFMHNCRKNRAHSLLFGTEFIPMIGGHTVSPAKPILVLAYLYGQFDREKDIPEHLRNKLAPSEG